MDQQTRTGIIAAAFAAAGPMDTKESFEERQAHLPEGERRVFNPKQAAAEHKAKVTEAIYQITVASADEKSWANRAIDQVSGPDVKMFTGTVLKVKREEKTTRGVVTLKTRVHADYAPDGTEEVRTERTDDPAGLSMARRLRSLVGHRVLLWVEIEKFTTKDGRTRKSRVVRHCEDLGVPQESDEE